MAGCPFTAKVFNWYEPEWPQEFKECFNPDVTPRNAGVVEKCSFCAHRLIKIKEKAAIEDREIIDGEYMPACAESCPADAIYFGDLNNKDSKVNKFSKSSRAYRELVDLGVEPKIFYLSGREY